MAQLLFDHCRDGVRLIVPKLGIEYFFPTLTDAEPAASE
jgi:hypothetical protein